MASAGAAERPKTALELGIMQGSPPADQCRVTHDNWDRAPFNRWTFQRVREVLPTVPVRRGAGPVRSLKRADQDLGTIGFETTDGRQLALQDFLERRAWFHVILGETVDLRITPVADHQTLVAVNSNAGVDGIGCNNRFYSPDC